MHLLGHGRGGRIERERAVISDVGQCVAIDGIWTKQDSGERRVCSNVQNLTKHRKIVSARR